MKVVILCGGQGSRIKDVNELVPKPMIPIGTKPILWHIMKIYAAYGLEDFVLCLGYKGWQIKEFFLNYFAMVSDCTLELGKPHDLDYHGNVKENNWKVTLANTGLNSMTGARLWRVRKYVEKEDHFCLTYGDGVADVNIKELIEYHIKSGLVVTITGVKVRERFGELQYDGSKITSFAEKPLVTTGRINGGFMVFDAKRVWDYFTDSPDMVLERGPLERLASDGELGIYKHDGYWQCMDTPRELTMLNELWESGKAPWKIW